MYYRKEYKYVIPCEMAYSLESHLEGIFERTSFSASGEYSVRSLYLDSVNNTDYYSKLDGLEHRKKYRIRIYNGDSSFCRFEKKEKTGELQHKAGIRIKASEARACCSGDYEFLLDYADGSGFAESAYAELISGIYRPRVLIEYKRLAYVYPAGDIRITIDSDIRSCETDLDLFSSDVGYVPEMSGYVVLEVKFSGILPDIVTECISAYGMEQESYSKYCYGRNLVI